EEVDVIERVEKFRTQFKVDVFTKPDLLGKRQIEPGETWSVQNQVAEPASSGVGLNTITKTRRGDEAAGWRAGPSVADGNGAWLTGWLGRDKPDGVCADGVITNVLRKDVDKTVGVTIRLNGILELLGGHADELDIAQRERRAALNANVTVEAPATYQLIKPAAGVAQEGLAFSKGQFVDEVGLETVTDVEVRHALLQPQITQRQRLIVDTGVAGEHVRQRFTKGIARLDQQTLRHASPELNSHSVIPGLTQIV